MRYGGRNALLDKDLPTDLRETIDHLRGLASSYGFNVIGASWPDAPVDQGYGVVIELPGGALVGHEFRDDEDAIEFEGGPSDIANDIARSYKAMLPLATALAELAERVQRATVSAIEAFPEGNRLVAVNQIVFSAYHAPGATNPNFELMVDCLGPYLRPHRETLVVSDEAEAVAALLDTLNVQAQRRAERARLESLGADGRIDLLTLSAIGTGDDLTDSLRQALRHERLDRQPSLRLLARRSPTECHE